MALQSFGERQASHRDFSPRLAEYVTTAIKKGLHALIEGSLVSSTYTLTPSELIGHLPYQDTHAR